MTGQVISNQWSVVSGDTLPPIDEFSQMGRAAVTGFTKLVDSTVVRTMATPEKVALFVDCLRGRGWLTARAIEEESGLGDRVLRALAEASDGEIISGQAGYRLTCEASVAEIDHAEDWLRSQARKMEARAVAIRVARNRRRFTAVNEGQAVFKS